MPLPVTGRVAGGCEVLVVVLGAVELDSDALGEGDALRDGELLGCGWWCLWCVGDGLGEAQPPYPSLLQWP